MRDDRSSDRQTRSIEIPERTAEALSRRRSGTEFDSIDEYAAFALEQLLEELDRQRTGTRPGDSSNGDDGDTVEESVETRLDALGCL